MVLSLDRWVNKVAVVTGTSSGIGVVIAEKLVENGIKVVGLARRKDRLDELSKKLEGKTGSFHGIKADMTKEEDILNAFKWVKENLGPVHILINNAAALVPETLTEGTTKHWISTFQLNVIGVCIATREAIKVMRENKIDGHIVHINSVAGQRVPNFPKCSVYPATKFAVRALAETLRLELNSQKSKIKITNLSPGLTETEAVPDEIKKVALENKGIMIEPEQIADAVVYVLSTPPHVQIQELTIRPIFDIELSKV